MREKYHGNDIDEFQFNYALLVLYCDAMMSGQTVEDRGELMTIVFMLLVRALLPFWKWVSPGKGRRQGTVYE